MKCGTMSATWHVWRSVSKRQFEKSDYSACKLSTVYTLPLSSTLDKYTPTLTAVTLFYSRIILKKLTTENKRTFWKLKKSVRFSV